MTKLRSALQQAIRSLQDLDAALSDPDLVDAAKRGRERMIRAPLHPVDDLRAQVARRELRARGIRT